MSTNTESVSSRGNTSAKADLWFRRILVFFPAALITLAAGVLMADLLWRVHGAFNGALVLLLVIFLILYSLLTLGLMTVLAGYFMGRLRRINLTSSLKQEDLERPFGLTAVVFPIYNENPQQIFERLRSVYLSLEETGRISDYEFHILSDSTNPDNYIQENYAWTALCRELDAFGRIFYRRRKQNVNRKAGNIADFCQTWGGRYTYMLVMDADSVMSAKDILRMSALMEKYPKVGLLQTSPRLVNAESIHGRLQQFSVRLYGDMFASGINFWQGCDGNYWGHNALIRLAPFMEYCGLPDLPGREPFGGQILSHDFVEAALMRRAGWEVWLVWDLEGTYEEGPPSIVDSAKRERRWLQGNLQHTWLLFAGGLHPISRLHLLLGIMGYLGSACWFLFLVLNTLIVFNQKLIGLTMIPAESSLGKYLPLSVTQQGMIIFGATLTMLFLPKLLAFVECVVDWKRGASFGGPLSILGSLILETLYAALTAPIVMLFHTYFFACILLGRKVEWLPQQRGAVGTSWRVAAGTHGWQSFLGAAWLALAFYLEPLFGWWMVPVLGPMLLIIPISVWTSRPGPGLALRRLRLLLTPEESHKPQELAEIDRRMESGTAVLADRFVAANPLEGITRVLVDPYVNAIHVSALEGSGEAPESTPDLVAAGESLLVAGPESLAPELLPRVTSSPDLMMELHRRIWLTPAADLAPWWQNAIESYRRGG